MRTMLVGVLVLGMASFAIGQSTGSGTNSTDENAVSTLDEQGRQSALSGDPSFAEKVLASTYIGIDPSGATTTKQEEVASRKRGDMKIASIDERDRKVTVSGNTAVVTSVGDVKGSRNGHDISGTYRVSRVYAKQNGEWQQVLFQMTRVQSSPAPSVPQ
jgi:hypothetical protein